MKALSVILFGLLVLALVALIALTLLWVAVYNYEHNLKNEKDIED